MVGVTGRAALMAAKGAIEIEVENLDDLTERFKSLPNALLRGELDEDLGIDFRGYTLRERCMLAALVSMKTRYRCTRGRIAALAPELRKDALDTVINGLIGKGNLRRVRQNDPERRGRFVWKWQVSLRPIFLGLASQEDDADPADEEETAGQSIGGLPANGHDPRSTIGGSSTDGPSVDGSSVDGSSTLSIEEELGTSRKTRKTRTTTTSRARDAGRREEAEDQSASPNFDDLAVRALALAPHWSATKLDAVLHHPDILARAIFDRVAVEEVVLALAGGKEYGHTASPYRILEGEGVWWSDKLRTRPAQPEPSTYVPPQRGCGSCVAGVVFVDQPDGQDKAEYCPVCHPAKQEVAA